MYIIFFTCPLDRPTGTIHFSLARWVLLSFHNYIVIINAVFLQTIGIGMYDYVTLSCI